MFERFSEPARLALFHARAESIKLGGRVIEPEHVVLGILQVAPGAVMRAAAGPPRFDQLIRSLADAATSAEKHPVSNEVPFSSDTRALLERAAAEADQHGHRWVRPEHLILAALAAADGGAARALLDAGITVAAVRGHLATTPDQPADAPAESRVPAPGMISRHWKGVVKHGREDDYLAHLRRETLPSLARLDGFVAASILRRDVADGAEFEVITVWRSAAAVAAFAGGDVTKAVVPPAAQALMVRYDDRAVHYDIVA